MCRVTHAAIVAVTTVLLFWQPAMAQTAKPPIEAFGNLPAVTQPSLSPSGRYMAFIKPYQGRPAAIIVDLDTLGAKPTVVPYSDGFIVDVQWANDRRLIITVNLNQKFDTRIYTTDLLALYRTISVDTSGGNPVVLVDKDDRGSISSTASIADLCLERENDIYLNFGNGILSVDVETGKSYTAYYDKNLVVDWIMDGHCKLRALLERKWVAETEQLKRVDRSKDGTRTDTEIATFDVPKGETLGLRGLLWNGEALARTGLSANGRKGLSSMSLFDGKETPLFADDAYDVDDVLKDVWTGRTIGVTVVSDMPQYRYFEPALSEIQKVLESAYPDTSVHAVAWDFNKSRLVVAVEGGKTPLAYFLVDLKKGGTRRIGSTYPALDDSVLGDIKPYPYKARDGLDIPAILTLPPDKTPKNLPVVIMPHGGPIARDAMTFDWMAQFLANRGYAVLQPNFRGSSGYGKAFEEAGFGQWGLKMQDDVTDGVRKLIADGIADPKRICIVGASYGGYAALAGAAFTPDLYACAAAFAPVTDLKAFIAYQKEDYGKHSATIVVLSRNLGDSWSDAERLRATSPARHADAIRAPVLLMHGADDTTVRIEQSEIMFEALKDAKKSVSFVRIDGDTHYMHTAETRIRWLTELEKFLKENIGD